MDLTTVRICKAASLQSMGASFSEAAKKSPPKSCKDSTVLMLVFFCRVYGFKVFRKSFFLYQMFCWSHVFWSIYVCCFRLHVTNKQYSLSTKLSTEPSATISLVVHFGLVKTRSNVLIYKYRFKVSIAMTPYNSNSPSKGPRGSCCPLLILLVIYRCRFFAVCV